MDDHHGEPLDHSAAPADPEIARKAVDAVPRSIQERVHIVEVSLTVGHLRAAMSVLPNLL